MKAFIIAAVSLSAALFCAPEAYSWSYPGAGSISVGDVVPGDPVISVDARTLGLGGSSVASAEGVAAIFYNPAAMQLRRRRALSLNIYGNYLNEIVTGEDRYYSSEILYEMPVFGMMYPIGNLRLGIAMRRHLDMGYKSSNKVYSGGNPDTKKIDFKGGPSRLIFGASASLLENLNAGASLNLIAGGLEGNRVDTVFQNTKVSSGFENDFSGSFFELGLLYTLGRDLANIGFTFTPAYTLTSEWEIETSNFAWDPGDSVWGAPAETETSGKKELSIPESIALGIQYNFLGLDRTMITADIRRTNWSGFRYEEKDSSAAGYGDSIDPGYRDVTRFSVGAEHYVNFTTAIRTGFAYEPFYGATSADQVSFSAGVGRELNQNMFVDLAGMLGYRTYRGDNPFTDDDKTVSDTRLKLMASLEWLF